MHKMRADCTLELNTDIKLTFLCSYPPWVTVGNPFMAAQ